MTTLFEYPGKAAFARVIPKSKIYEYARPAKAIKELFTKQVEQIIWQYKLAPETINVKNALSVTEIQIFSITLKSGELKNEILRCIDQAIPSPIIFELRFDCKVKPIAAYKRQHATDAKKWTISEYFDGGWIPDNSPRRPLPMVFDLDALYGHLLTSLMPYPALPAENVQKRVERMENIRLKQRELEQCAIRLRKEKQFSRKVVINAELRDLKQELENMTGPFVENVM